MGGKWFNLTTRPITKSTCLGSSSIIYNGLYVRMVDDFFCIQRRRCPELDYWVELDVFDDGIEGSSEKGRSVRWTDAWGVAEEEVLGCGLGEFE